jgi:hypothetical protein
MSNPAKLPSIASLISTTWAQYRERSNFLLLISLVGSAVTVLCDLGKMWTADVSWYYFLLVIFSFVNLYVSFWTQGALMLAVRSKESKGVGYFFSQAQGKVITLLGAGLLSGLIVAAGLLLAIVPGIIFSVWFAFFSFFIMYEDKKAIQSLKASKALVKGRVFSIFLRWTILIIAYVAIFFLLAVITARNSIALSLVTSIFSALIMPFFVLYGYNLFCSLRRAQDQPTDNSI